MDSLIRQTRVRYSNVGQENVDELISSEDRSMPLQKSRSFQEEKKRAQNWLERQFSRQMSGDLDFNNQMERATAVAAAAYAIKSTKESPIPDKRKTSSGPSQPFMNRFKSEKEDTSNAIPEPKKANGVPERSSSRVKSKKRDTPEPDSVSKRFSGENATTSSTSLVGEVPLTATKDEKAPAKTVISPSLKKSTTFADEPLISPDSTKSKRTPSQVTVPGPSMKKTGTSADERLDRTSREKPEGDAPKVDLPPSSPGKTASKPEIPPPIKPATPPSETRRQRSTGPLTDGSKADPWVKAEMDKIKERYDKLNETIASWENKKKNKAKRKLEKTESELEKRRKKALQKFRSHMEYIDQIAGGARAQALEKRRNEEFKAKEKARKVEMAKITKRYDKLNETIASWENKKKNKAKRKLEKTESELEKKRKKALQKFRSDVESIDQIAGGTRAQALEKRRNEEFKAKEKANIIRTTGKLPATCFCF